MKFEIESYRLISRSRASSPPGMKIMHFVRLQPDLRAPPDSAPIIDAYKHLNSALATPCALEYDFSFDKISKHKRHGQAQKIRTNLTRIPLLQLQHRIYAPVMCNFFVWSATPCRFLCCAGSAGMAAPSGMELKMDKQNFLNDIQAKFSAALENSPAKDLEKNVKAMMTQGFSKLDLVTREEFDIQAQVLAKTRARLEALEARVTALEAQLSQK
jgi:BMFP domain-containing protein YqiC